jgi:hypothetical protein
MNCLHASLYMLFQISFVSFFLSLCFSRALPTINFFKMNLHTDNRMSKMKTTASASTAMTSSSKYWYQARSSTAERKWGVPLCRITYSVQYTACSSGVSGWSRMIRERRWAFSRYLWQPPNSNAFIWNSMSYSQCSWSSLICNNSSYNYKHIFLTNVNTFTHTTT